MINLLRRFTLISILFFSIIAQAKTLTVGTGKTYANPTQAASVAQPGDTILIFAGTYQGAFFITNLSGRSNAWIVIKGVDKNTVILKAGSEGLHLSDVNYIKIQDLTFTGQTANGMNIDDNGSIETPAKHVIVTNCNFKYMGAQGNNDFLKLSGLDSFEVTHCNFHKGATGGSGIDMVGCHFGLFAHNNFDSMGSNCIQMKGGTRYITIQNNWFKNGGQRSLNLGGSTGLEFFRPIDAKHEAADINVYSNVFIGSIAPIAFVGSERVDVSNNTIYMPEKWVIRILQETVDANRFVPCRNGMFRNNIIYYNSAVTTHVNIGSNTSPETFLFSNNLWYNSSNPSNSTPTLPTTETSGIKGQDPLFVSSSDFTLKSGSPAIGSGTSITALPLDMNGKSFKNPPSRGAYEYYSSGSLYQAPPLFNLNIYPNPSNGAITVESIQPIHLKIFNSVGQVVWEDQVIDNRNIQLPNKGIYFINYRLGGISNSKKIVVIH